MKARLWEIDHPYYCNEGCYFSNDCHEVYKTWQDFVDNWKDMDWDLNLVWRFDWRSGEGWELPNEDRLLVYFMLQRKARPLSAEIKVTRDQEPEIRECRGDPRR